MENGQAIRVVRGRYKSATGSIEEPDELEGFYWVWLDTWLHRWRGGKLHQIPGAPERVLLAVGQLERK